MDPIDFSSSSSSSGLPQLRRGLNNPYSGQPLYSGELPVEIGRIRPLGSSGDGPVFNESGHRIGVVRGDSFIVDSTTPYTLPIRSVLDR